MGKIGPKFSHLLTVKLTLRCDIRESRMSQRQKCVFRIKHEVTKEHLSPIKYVVFNLLSVKIPIFSLFLKKQFDLFDKKTQNFCQSLPLKPPKFRNSESTGASVAGTSEKTNSVMMGPDSDTQGGYDDVY